MIYHPSFSSLAHGRGGLVFIAATAAFALGVLTGATLRPSPTTNAAGSLASALAATRAAPTSADIPLAHRLDPGLVYPADTLRIIDGDTFEARVRVWPGLDVNTKVRLRNIDARSFTPGAPTSTSRRRPRAPRSKPSSRRAALRFRGSVSTNTVDGSMRSSRRATRPTFPRRFSTAAGRAATMAAGAVRGADLEVWMSDPDPPTLGTRAVSASRYLPNI
jgi:endonuclease YncB( thermonuclease family)